MISLNPIPWPCGAPYRSPNAAAIPPQYQDPDSYWTGLAGRARVLLVNTTHLSPSRYPHSIRDLLDPAYPPERVAIAMPLFGTSATLAAALYAHDGPDAGRRFCERLHARGVRLVDGNSTVRDMVATGQLFFGVVDTDDACAAVTSGAPVIPILPDQGSGALGTLVIPGSVALLAGAPHSAAGKRLVDFLLRPETEALLVQSGWCHVPLRRLDVRPGCQAQRPDAPLWAFDPATMTRMVVEIPEVVRHMRLVKQEMTDLLLR
jgi:iron(III) transport system substrate-binding protein